MTSYPKCRPSFAFHECVTKNGSTAVLIQPKYKGSSCCHGARWSCPRRCPKSAPPQVCPTYRWQGGPVEICPQPDLPSSRQPYANSMYHTGYDQSPGRSQPYQYYDEEEHTEDIPHFYQVTGSCNANKDYKRCRSRCREFHRPWPVSDSPQHPELYMQRNNPQEKCCCAEFHGLKRLNEFDLCSQW